MQFGKTKNHRTTKSQVNNQSDKTKKVKSHRKNIKLYLIAFVLLILLFSYFVSVFSYTETLLSRYSSLSNNCKNIQKSLFSSTLQIQVNDKYEINSVMLDVIYNNQSKSISLDNVIFDIDNNGTKGSLRDYAKATNIFLDKKKIYEYFSNLFYRKFRVKIDYVFIVRSSSDLRNYLDELFLGKYFELFNSSTESIVFIEGDVCKASLEEYWKLLNESQNKGVIKPASFTSYAEIFDLKDLRKEQIRIFVTNKTGSESEGRRFVSMLEGYGLNVVKLEYKGEVEKTSQIFINKDEINETISLSVVKYLISNQVNEIKISTKINVFADFEIIIGEDIVTI